MDAPFVLELPVTEEDLAKLSGEGHAAFFVALPIDSEQKVIHVELYHKQIYDFVYSSAGVERGEDQGVSPLFRRGARLERKW